MIELRQSTGLCQVELDIPGTRHPRRARYLDRHRTVKLVVVGQVDPAEPALAQPPEDPIPADHLGIAQIRIRRPADSDDGRS